MSDESRILEMLSSIQSELAGMKGEISELKKEVRNHDSFASDAFHLTQRHIGDLMEDVHRADAKLDKFPTDIFQLKRELIDWRISASLPGHANQK